MCTFARYTYTKRKRRRHGGGLDVDMVMLIHDCFFTFVDCNRLSRVRECPVVREHSDFTQHTLSYSAGVVNERW